MLLNYGDQSKVVNADGSRREPTLAEVFKRFFLVFFDPYAAQAWRIESNPRNIASTASRYHLITALKIAFIYRGGDINEWIEQTPQLSSTSRVRKYKSKAMEKPEINYDPSLISMDYVAPQADTDPSTISAAIPADPEIHLEMENFDVRRTKSKKRKAPQLVVTSEEEAEAAVIPVIMENTGSSTGSAARSTRRSNPMEPTVVQKWKLTKQMIIDSKRKKGFKKPMLVDLSAVSQFNDDIIIPDRVSESDELDKEDSDEDLSSVVGE
jgi:hypothetical protein